MLGCSALILEVLESFGQVNGVRQHPIHLRACIVGCLTQWEVVETDLFFDHGVPYPVMRFSRGFSSSV